MERRKFITDGCKLCMAITGGSALISLIQSCTPLPLFKTISENNKVKIPIDKFGVNSFLIVRPTDFNYDVAVIKTGNQEYKSIVMQCTHADNPVRFNGNEFNCNMHGSIFSRSGQVLKGPAEKNLTVLKTDLINNVIVVTLV